MSQICRGVHWTPALMNVYVYTYIFDVMKIVYSILHAMRAIVCIGTRTGEHGSPLQNCSNGSYTTLGHNMFFTLQTVFPTLIFHFQFSILHLITFARA